MKTCPRVGFGVLATGNRNAVEPAETSLRTTTGEPLTRAFSRECRGTTAAAVGKRQADARQSRPINGDMSNAQCVRSAPEPSYSMGERL